jgi:hypothetical protein
MSSEKKPDANSCTVYNDKKIITCPACEGKRKVDGPCSLCDGSGTIKCPFCKEIWQLWHNVN